MFYTIYIYISLYIFNLNINNDYITVKTVFILGMIRKSSFSNLKNDKETLKNTFHVLYNCDNCLFTVTRHFTFFTKQEFRFRHNTNKLQTLL